MQGSGREVIETNCEKAGHLFNTPVFPLKSYINLLCSRRLRRMLQDTVTYLTILFGCARLSFCQGKQR